jgi:ABC-type branched-subunit amino acid transport system substrate-binding protein
MKSKKILFIIYILFVFNSNLFSAESDKKLRVGLLAPLSGPYNEIGNSLLYSLQLALEEIDDENLIIVPKDSGFNDDKKIISAIDELKSSGVKIIIGPLTHEEFNQAKKYNDITFISPSNISPEFSKNIISIGISLESQLISLFEFIKNQKKNKDYYYVSKK